VSIDISILNVLQGGITKPVFAQSVGLNEVIPKVNSIAQEIVDTISTGFEGLPPEKSSVQPPVVDETLLEEGENSDGASEIEINSLDENLVYQKSVNELDKNAETENDAISEQE
jgi:hypothetical protein